MASNYDDVLAQITGYGLIVRKGLEIGRFVRCAVDGDREKRGWYILHEVTSSNGQPLLIGSYGIWQGSEPNAQKITFEKSELTNEQKAAFKKRLEEESRRAKAAAKLLSDEAARQAEKRWRLLSADGHANYLDRKAVGAFGVKFNKTGAVVVPITDVSGRIYGLQYILDKTIHKDKISKNNGRDKRFWPSGMEKKGHFFLIGGIPSNILLITVHPETRTPSLTPKQTQSPYGATILAFSN